MNQSQWPNDISLLGPAPILGPPFFMDGSPMGGGLMPGPQMHGPSMLTPQVPGPNIPGLNMPGPNIPGLSMPGDKEIDEVIMEDQDQPNDGSRQNWSNGQGNNRSSRFNNDQDNIRSNRKRGLSSDRHDLRQDITSRDNRDRNADRSRRRSRERSDRSDRSDRRGGDRGRPRSSERRERRTKWDSIDKPAPNVPSMMPQNNIGLGQPGVASGIMQFQNMYNMQQQQMDMSNNPNMISNMGMPNMQGNMTGMHGNMPPNNMMMDQNMGMMSNMHGGMMNPMMGNMAMNMPMMTPNQPVFLNNAVLLPPAPNTQTPSRRERPKGCRTIFIGGLPENMEEETVWEIFQRFGTISNVKLNKKGFCHLRFLSMDSVEPTFCLSGCRFKYLEQPDTDAMTIFIDYALNRDDQQDFERQQKTRELTPPPIEPFTPANLNSVTEMIKSEDKFAEAAPSLVYWLERGECNKRNANVFYSLIQASNNQVRRLFTEKMTVDEELNNLKVSLREKFLHIIAQFEQVSKILEAAKHQRVWDHFSKQQRRNIEMWQKMTLELDNMRDEFNTLFDEEDDNKPNKKSVSVEKYEELKRENDQLTYELEGYKNEAYVAKDEAERKFEKFKAHFIAQQALQNKQPYHPLPPPPPMPPIEAFKVKTQAPPPPADDGKAMAFTGAAVSVGEGRLISLITAFLLVHPLGANLDYIHSYVRSMLPSVNQATVHSLLQKYGDVFTRKSSGVGASIDHKWLFCTFDDCKAQAN